ncbi:MAG: hypothetical protein COA43_02510 [Robiginitomaculum sp.]|nr:MAG: hypothetical protein COA43_02510 [Robiginitomaculum sp.]
MNVDFLATKNTKSVPTSVSTHDETNAILSLIAAAPYVWKIRDGKESFQWQSESLTSSLFCCRAEIIPNTLSAMGERMCDDAKSTRAEALRSLTWNGAKFQIDYQIRTFDGRNIWVEERAERISGDETNPTKIIGVLTNIQSRKVREEQAGYHASYDSLTGLWNRPRMAEGITQMLAFSRRYDRESAFVIFRIANVPDINLTYGYEAGDRLLTAIAKRLTKCVRSPDVCARISGVSFGIGLSDCNAEQMELVAKRILETLTASPYGTPYGDLYPEFSVGGTICSKTPMSASDIMEHAYTAAAHSELQSGEFIAYASELPDLKPRQKMTELTRDDIIQALNDRRISLAYQPIVHAQSREPHHYECLLRLRRDDGEIVSAAQFIMAAEKLECVHMLDRRAMEIASVTLQEHSTIKLALNVSAATVKNRETADEYLHALKGLGKAAERVIVELTETVALDDPALASRFAVEVRALGCDFAIDDFGAGHTTFRNLMAIEADEIKIDGSFIRDLSLTPHKQVFVRMMVELAQTFSVKTVAEMVGSREDAELLTRLGVDYLQGYMFGMPSPVPVIPKGPQRKAMGDARLGNT